MYKEVVMGTTMGRSILLVFMIVFVNCNGGPQPVFEYHCVGVRPDRLHGFREFVRAPIVHEDTISFTHCFGGTYCKYVFRLVVNKDTLWILDSCVAGTMERTESNFCVSCKIYGLKKGVYFLNYQGSPIRMEIR
jgi:hypothetical protein